MSQVIMHGGSMNSLSGGAWYNDAYHGVKKAYDSLKRFDDKVLKKYKPFGAVKTAVDYAGLNNLAAANPYATAAYSGLSALANSGRGKKRGRKGKRKH